MTNELYHHGIKGQQWGVQNGPPYPLDQSDLSPAERRLAGKEKGYEKYGTNSEENKEIAKRNAIAAYKNLKNTKAALQIQSTEKKMKKGKEISEKELSKYNLSKGIATRAVAEIDRADCFAGTNAINKALNSRMFKDSLVDSVALTVGFNAGKIALLAMGIPVPAGPPVIPVPDVPGNSAVSYINNNRSKTIPFETISKDGTMTLKRVPKP